MIDDPELIDFGDDDSNLPSDTAIKTVAELAQEQREAEAAVIAATATLRAALDRLYAVRDASLPMAMIAAGTRGFTLEDGTKVGITTKFDAGKLTDPAGLAYVEANGGAAIIKTSLNIELDRGDVAAARELLNELRAHRFANRFKVIELSENVHSQTIAAWVRRLVEEGKDPPLAQLGVRRRTYSVVGSAPKTIDLKGFIERT